MRGIVCLTIVCLSATVHSASPQYKCKSLGHMTSFNGLHVRVNSFTVGDRITAMSFGGTAFLYESGVLTNLTNHWNYDVYGSVQTNDRQQFSQSDRANIVQFKPTGNEPWQWLHPIGDYADSVYANGMTNNFIFGAQKVAGNTDYAEPLTYNTMTGETTAFSTLPYGYRGGEIQDMNEQGDMLVRMSNALYDQVGMIYGNMSIFRNGVRAANLGNMLRGAMNSKGQAVGESYDKVSGNYSSTFWDGTQLHVINPYLNQGGFWPSGLSDDGTILMIDGSKIFVVNALYKDGQYYNFSDVCPDLPAGMTIHSARIRPDGAIAGIGVLNNETYLMRFDPVPEPASLVALGVGAVALVRRKRQ